PRRDAAVFRLHGEGVVREDRDELQARVAACPQRIQPLAGQAACFIRERVPLCPQGPGRAGRDGRDRRLRWLSEVCHDTFEETHYLAARAEGYRVQLLGVLFP